MSRFCHVNGCLGEHESEFMCCNDHPDAAPPLDDGERVMATIRNLRAEIGRLREAAREAVGETVIIRDGEFATFDGHWVMVEKYAMEMLRAAFTPPSQAPEARRDVGGEKL